MHSFRMTIKGLIWLTFVTVSSSLVNAQAPTLVSLTPPSPTAQAFQKYGDIPVSAYTGIPDISIPIYTIKYKDITIPISLSYHASGIKVAEEASNVGLGWVLNAAGTISRNIIGTDDFTGSVYFNSTVKDFVNGQGPASSVTAGCNLAYFNMHSTPTSSYYNIDTFILQAPPIDFQPDQYYYSYPGHSGKFVLTRNWQAPALVQKQEAIQVNCMAADGSSFQVKSAEGFIYDYTLYETFTDFTVHKSAWYLTKITSPLGNIVTFNYTPFSSVVQTIGSYSESRDDWASCLASPSNPTTLNGWQHGAVAGKAYASQILTSINFTNGQVKFFYSFGRTDLPNDSQLDSVAIYAQNATQPTKAVKLSYSYFTGIGDPSFFQGSGNLLYQRLKLSQVTEYGYYNGQSIQNPPYIFTYNESITLPAKTSFARDHWGYYNGVTGRGTLIPDPIIVNSIDPIVFALGLPGLQREANSYFTPAFTLSTLKYPSGGWTEFQYESNDYDEANSTVNDHSYFQQIANLVTPVKKTPPAFTYDAISHLYGSGGTSLDLTNIYINAGVALPVTLSAYFRFSGGTGGNCNDILGGVAGQVWFELVNSSGGQVFRVDPFEVNVCNVGGTNTPCVGCQTGMPLFTFNSSYNISAGVYTWRAHVVGTTGAAAKIQDMSASFSWYEMSSTGAAQTNTISVGGGLRIKRIINHDGINEQNNSTKRYVYHYFADKTSSGNLAEYSYGRRMSKPQYAFFVPGYDESGVTVAGSCVATPYYVMHLTRVGDSYNPLNGSAASAAVGYDQVTELIGENGEFGKKVYQYSNSPDIINSFAEQFSLSNLPVRPPYGSNIVNLLNGSLTNETDYVSLKGNYYKVKEVNNQYTAPPTSEVIDYAAENRTSLSASHNENCGLVNPLACDQHSLTLVYRSMQSDWMYMSSSDEKIYNQGGDEAHFTETLTNYFYDNPLHLQLTRTQTTNSKNETITSTMKYPLDYTIPGGANDAFTLGVQNLVNKHVISAPLEKYVQKNKSDGTYMGAISYVLTSYNSTLPKPSLAYLSMLTAPNTSFTASSISVSGLVKDAAYQPLISFDAYDASGNLTQQHKVNDINHSYVWDYNNSLVIGEASNAAVNEIAATSFEADGLGGWTLTDATRTAGGITGAQSYTISAGKTISKSGLTSGKKYIVSYWSKNGAVTVNGVAATAGPVKNGWTYYEHSLPNTTTSVSITGAANVDELRLFPSDSQMITYTYFPLVGVTSTCTVNNIIQYYIYDAFGRLKQINDQDGNILKTVETHYQNQVGQ